METQVTQKTVENAPVVVNGPVEPEVEPQEQDKVVLEEVEEKEVYGLYTASVKWFNDKLGYGFITICDGPEKGKDIFVHHSGITPLNSNYKTLRKGEYIQFNIIHGMNGLQAVDVTGIKGGPLMCDYVTSKRVTPPPLLPTSRVQPYTQQVASQGEDAWQTVPRRARPPPPPREAGAVDGPQRPTSLRPHKNVAKYNKATRPK